MADPKKHQKTQKTQKTQSENELQDLEPRPRTLDEVKGGIGGVENDFKARWVVDRYRTKR